MSNFHIFKDPITADTQPASNLLPDLPPNPLPVYLCFCCLYEKANTEFLPDELLLATPTPLREATNEQNVGRKRRRNGPTCIVCQEKQKRRSQACRAKADEGKQQERVPWKEIVHMIEDGFRFYLFILTIVRFHHNSFCLFSIFFRNFPQALYNRIILQLQKRSGSQ